MDSLTTGPVVAGPGTPAVVRPGERVCAVDELTDGGLGLRFLLMAGSQTCAAFVIRHAGRVYGYLNRCPHRTLELDWMEGTFFDARGEFLVCATHGARYHPANGACVDGPCLGRGLVALALELDGEEVRLAAHPTIPDA